MRPVIVAILVPVLLLCAAPAIVADGDVPVTLLVEVVERTSFDDLAAQIAAGSTPLGAAPEDLARAFFAPSVTLRRQEREALLLNLLRTTSERSSRHDLCLVLFARIEDLDDWSLLALLFEQAAHAGAGSLAHALEAAERILTVLEAPSSQNAGYERAAIAVAEHARAVYGTTSAADASTSALALAETLRSIARLSRSEAVVGAARASARELLGLPASERDD